MKKSFQGTLVLLGVFVVLLGWYLIYEKRIKVDQEEKQEQAKVLLTLERDDVQELVIEQRQGEGPKYKRLVFKKLGTEWNLVEPIEDAAELGAINGLVNALTGTKQERVVEEKPQNLEPFGLAVPALKITAKKDSSTAAQTLLVGQDTPVGSGVYVKVEGKDPVFRASTTLRTSFNKEPSEYRNKKVIPFARADVLEAEIKNPSGTFVLKRQGTTENWMLARENLPASEAEVNKLLNAVVALQATGFAADKPGKGTLGRWGLGPAAVTLTLKKQDGQTLLHLSKVGDKHYALRSDKDMVYEVPQDAYTQAIRAAKEYRDLRMASFNRFDVKRFIIEHGDTSFELVKEGSDWKIPADATAQIDTAKVEDYLSRLQDVKVVEYLKNTPKPKSPAVSVRLYTTYGDEAKETLAIRLAKPSGQKAVGERTGLEQVFTISEADFKRVNAFKQEVLKADKKAESKADTKAKNEKS